MTASHIPSPVLVTGAGGLIGSAICRELSKRGIETRALLAHGESAENVEGLPNISILRGDVRKMEEVRRAVSGCASVIHAAALNTLWHRPARDFYTINVKGTYNVLKAAHDAGVEMFVHTSSCEVFGRAREGAMTDEMTPLDIKRVSGHYERSKFMAELAVVERGEAGLPATIIRPTAVIGPHDIHGSPPGMLIKAFLEQRIPAYYDAGINVVDSRDVALAHIAALERRSHGRAFIVGGHNIKFSELIDELSKASKIPAPRTRVGYRTALAAALFRSLTSLITGDHPGITVNGIRTIRHPWHFDTSRAKNELGLVPRPLADTVRDAVSWFVVRGS